MAGMVGNNENYGSDEVKFLALSVLEKAFNDRAINWLTKPSKKLNFWLDCAEMTDRDLNRLIKKSFPRTVKRYVRND